MKKKAHLQYSALSMSIAAALIFALSLIDFSVPAVNEKTIARCSKFVSEKHLYVRNMASGINSLADFDAIPVEQISPDLSLFLFQDGKLLRWIHDIPADEAELFSIDTCLQYMKIHNGWYLTRKYERANFDMVITLFIQSSYPCTNQWLRNEPNSALGFSNDIYILPLDSPNGSTIYGADNIPLFKITSVERDLHYSINLLLRWIAVALTLAGIFLFFLCTQRSRLVFLFIALLLALRAILFFGGDFFSGKIRLFSPYIYANSSYFNSLGALLLDAVFAFLIVSMLYYWRKAWRMRYAHSSAARKYTAMVIALAVIATAAYWTHYIVWSLSLNSIIDLSFHQPTSPDIYSVFAYIILCLVYSSLFLMLHLYVRTFCPKLYHKRIRRIFFLCYLLFMPAYTLYVNVHNKQQLEQAKIAVWAYRIAVKHDTSIVSNERGYPDLLVRQDVMSVFQLPFNYSYGKYLDGNIVRYAGEYDYPFHLKKQWKEGLSPVEDNNRYRHFIYNIEDTHTIVISRKNTTFLGYAAAFSYNLLFFSIGFVLLLQTTGRRIPIWPKNKLRKQITFTLFALLVFSVLFVGVSSILYSRTQYDTITKKRRDDRVELVMATLDPYLTSLRPDNLHHAPSLAAEITRIAHRLWFDINIYDADGKLSISSRPEIFTNYLQSPRMNADALKALSRKEIPQFITTEKIGKKEYLSNYITYHIQDGEFIAFINLPNFVDRENRAREISTMIAAYANLYIVLMIIAIFMGFALSNRLSKPINILRRHLQRFDILAAPEYINYTSDDEIGAVVTAYNEMITALDKSAKQLAKSERESAWREMARQIAHEIKNPLTPMRLSLQHLVQLKKDNHPDWKNRFDEVSTTLLNQIDTLTRTASEFSSLAKINRDTTSIVDLKTVLQAQQPLFDNYPHIHYTTTVEVEEAPIKAHQEQISRVLMNLLTNAVQALEENEHGIIATHLRETVTDYHIAIEDNGKGIAAEMEDKLFAPNFTTKKSGSGLGLFICRNILEDYGGTITYSRSSLGGACFSICLPKLRSPQ